MKRIETTTRRLVIRPVRHTDYAVWFDAYVNGLPKKSEWDDYSAMSARKCTRTIFKKVLKRHLDEANKDDYYRFGIFEKKSGSMIGHIDFNIYSREALQFANFGYVLGNRYWGKGYGQEAAKAGLKIGIKSLKLHRLEAAIDLENKKSIRLAKMIGMKKEGIKKAYWKQNGKWTDQMVYVSIP